MSQRKKLLLPLMLVLFISTLDQTIVATALSRIGAAMSDSTDAPWIATSYLLTSAVSTLVLGKLGDMVGRKSMLQLSVVVFVVGSALCAAAPRMGWLIAARALQGIGGGGLNSLVMAVVGDLVPARERASYQATLGIVPALAIVLGPILGGLLVDRAGWPWIFLINLPLGVFAFWAIATRLHLKARGVSRHVDWAGAFLATIMTTSLLLATVHTARAAPLVIAGVLTLAAYCVVEHRALEPITPLPLFADSVFSIAVALFFLSTAVLFVGLLFVPLMLQTVFGLSALAAGGCIVPLLLGLIVGTMVTGAAISRRGRYKAYPVVGAVLCGGALLLLSRTAPDTPVWRVLASVTALGLGIGFFIQVVVLAGQNAVEHRHLGVATGTLNFFKTMGGAAGAAVFGAVLSHGLSHAAGIDATLAAFRSVFLDASLLMLVALALASAWRERPLSAQMVEVAEGLMDVPEF